MSIHIANKALYASKCAKIVASGMQSLMVISDFDHTITSPKKGGVPSWGAVAAYRGGNFTDTIAKESIDEFHHYHAIEIDPTLPRETKEDKMKEWWLSAHARLLRCEPRRDTFRAMVEQCSERVKFRDSVSSLFDSLLLHKVPLLIFSAGIGEVIEEMLKLTGHFESHDNIHIVSNFMQYNEEGVGITWNDEEELIHVYNKHIRHCDGKDFMNEIDGRHNAILLGDSVGDAEMSDGLEQLTTTLRIGFLNKDVEERLPNFEKAFDVVLIDDDSFGLVTNLVDEIVSLSKE